MTSMLAESPIAPVTVLSVVEHDDHVFVVRHGAACRLDDSPPAWSGLADSPIKETT